MKSVLIILALAMTAGSGCTRLFLQPMRLSDAKAQKTYSAMAAEMLKHIKNSGKVPEWATVESAFDYYSWHERPCLERGARSMGFSSIASFEAFAARDLGPRRHKVAKQVGLSEHWAEYAVARAASSK